MNTSNITGSNAKGNSDSRAWKAIKVIRITRAAAAKTARAYADLRLETDKGDLAINGFCILEKDGQRWVNFPHRHANDGKWYPIVDANGELKELLFATILDAYSESLKSNH